jgi:hypothetical protein
MIDRDGNTIHIGETVTLVQGVIPAYLFGDRAVVLSLGDINLKLQLLDPKHEGRVIYVKPNHMLVGSKQVFNLDQKRALTILDNILKLAIHREVITERQYEQIQYLIPKEDE